MAMQETAPSATHPPCFHLFLTGEILDGFDTQQVQQWLAQTLSLSSSHAAGLLTGKSTCIKKNLDKAQAAQYQNIFETHGVAVRIQEISAPKTIHASNTDPSPSQTERTQVIRTSFFNGALNSAPAKAFSTLGTLTAFIALFLTLLFYGSAALGLMWLSVFLLIKGVLALMGTPHITQCLLYCLPALLALLTLMLLLRVAIHRTHPTDSVLTLDSSEQVKLAQYIREIYALIGSPAPQEINLNNDATCRAHYHFSLATPFAGHRELSLGIPLMLTLNTRQLAALIAHEAARLKTPAAAFVETLSHRVYQRFHHATGNTDGWAIAAEQRLHHPQGRFSQVANSLNYHALNISALLLQPFAYWLTTSLRFAGKLQVLTADHTAIALSGTREFVSTLIQIHSTYHALHEARKKLFDQPGEQRLINNFPALIKHCAQALDSKTLKALADDVNRGQTRQSSHYPSDRDRIIYAEDLDLIGIDAQELPAVELLEKANTLFYNATLLYYQNQSLDFSPDKLIDVSQLTHLAQKDQLRDQLSAHYFNQWFKPEVFWRIPTPSEVESLSQQQRVAQLNELILRIRHATPDYLNIQALAPRTEAELTTFALGNEIRKAGGEFSASELSLSAQQYDNFQQYYQKAKRDYQSLLARQHKFNDLMGSRLFLGIALHPEASKRQRGIYFLQLLTSLFGCNQKLQSLQIRVNYLPILAARSTDKKETNLQQRTHRITRDINEYCDNIILIMNKYRCNFHKDFTSAGQFIRAHTKIEIDKKKPQPLESIQYFHQVLHGLHEANRLINRELSLLAIDSEQANNVSPIRITI